MYPTERSEVLFHCNGLSVLTWISCKSYACSTIVSSQWASCQFTMIQIKLDKFKWWFGFVLRNVQVFVILYCLAQYWMYWIVFHIELLFCRYCSFTPWMVTSQMKQFVYISKSNNRGLPCCVFLSKKKNEAICLHLYVKDRFFALHVHSLYAAPIRWCKLEHACDHDFFYGSTATCSGYCSWHKVSSLFFSAENGSQSLQNVTASILKC